jgi:hypothetical protein
VQVLGAGGALGGPAHTGVNFGGNPANLGAAPHDWGFAKNETSMNVAISVQDSQLPSQLWSTKPCIMRKD